MVLGMAAAASALDLIKTLTQSGSSKTKSSTGFTTGATSASASSATTGFSGASGSGQTSLISPDTMNALFAAQNQSGTTSSATSSSDALKDLFSKLDGDGDGKISKSEFESALGAGGTNTANADKVFDKLDTDGDGSVSAGELSSALKSKHHAHGAKHGGGAGGSQDALLQALDGASSTSSTNSDGSVTTALTYADGSTVTMTQPAASSQSSSATRSYNAIEQMIQRQSDMLTKNVSSSLSVSV